MSQEDVRRLEGLYQVITNAVYDKAVAERDEANRQLFEALAERDAALERVQYLESVWSDDASEETQKLVGALRLMDELRRANLERVDELTRQVAKANARIAELEGQES